jgi:hypothetical protein
MNLTTTVSTSDLGATTRRSQGHRIPSGDPLAPWTRLMTAVLVVQLVGAIWVLLDADQSATPVAAIAIALAAPIAGLMFEVLAHRKVLALWSTGSLALLWLTQTVLLLLWHTCGPLTLALVCIFGAAVLLFVLCPMVIWPTH